MATEAMLCFLRKRRGYTKLRSEYSLMRRPLRICIDMFHSLGYIRTERNKAAKIVDDLEKRVTKSQGRKIVFLDDEDEQLERLEGDIEMEENATEDPISKKLRVMKEKGAQKLESKLATARHNLEVLAEAEEALDLQRAKMTKTMTVGGVNRQGIAFKVRERKK